MWFVWCHLTLLRCRILPIFVHSSPSLLISIWKSFIVSSNAFERLSKAILKSGDFKMNALPVFIAWIWSLRSPSTGLFPSTATIVSNGGTPRCMAQYHVMIHKAHGRCIGSVRRMLTGLRTKWRRERSVLYVLFLLIYDGANLQTASNVDTDEVYDDDWDTESNDDNGLSNTFNCVDQWRNARSDIWKKNFSVFKESGIFVATCRHRFVLLACDMIKSRELCVNHYRS